MDWMDGRNKNPEGETAGQFVVVERESILPRDERAFTFNSVRNNFKKERICFSFFSSIYKATMIIDVLS